MRALAGALLMCTIASVAAAQPRIAILGGDTVNFGRVGAEILRHDLNIVNSGSDTLRISEVRPSCGCTTAPIDRTVLPPGDTATVDITLDIRSRRGEVTKFVAIASNDPKRPTASACLRAFVVQDVVAEAGHFPFVDALKVGEDHPSELSVTNIGDTPITFSLPPTIDDDSVRVEFAMIGDNPLPPGEKIVVRALVRPKSLGLSTHVVTLRTSGFHTPELKLSLFSRVLSSQRDTTAR